MHSSLAARLDQPAWHLVQALNTLVTPTGDPAIDGFFEKVRALTPAEHKMLDLAAKQLDEQQLKESLGIKTWARNATWRQALEDGVSRPTVTIEGLVGGYTGPGGKTILPHRMVAKLDMRLVPNMTPDDTVAKLKAHLAKRGFGDIEVAINGGMNEVSSTSADSRADPRRASDVSPVRHRAAAAAALRRLGPELGVHRCAAQAGGGSFGMGFGDRAHAPDEYYVIESNNPKVSGIDGAVRSFVDCLYALA